MGQFAGHIEWYPSLIAKLGSTCQAKTAAVPTFLNSAHYTINREYQCDAHLVLKQVNPHKKSTRQFFSKLTNASSCNVICSEREQCNMSTLIKPNNLYFHIEYNYEKQFWTLINHQRKELYFWNINISTILKSSIKIMCHLTKRLICS